MNRERGAGTSTGTLYLVATPIGDLRDVTYRAVDVLSRVAVIACEDTREVRALLSAHGIKARTLSYHDHNERARSQELVERLLSGEDVALVSDAGTPLINDPGYRLVRAAIDAGVPVTSVPGPCAAVAALAASGLPPDRFVYAGYPPRTSAKRRTFYGELAGERATLIVYEAPHRLVGSLRDALAMLGDREACLARNLTKPHERYQRGRLGDLVRQLEGEGDVRGEVTVVIAGRVPDADEVDDQEDARRVAAARLAEGMAPRAVVDELQRVFKLRRRAAYALLLEAQKEATAEGAP